MELVDYIKKNTGVLANGWEPTDVKSDRAVNRMSKAKRAEYINQLLKSFHKHSLVFGVSGSPPKKLDWIPEISIRAGVVTIKMFSCGLVKYQLSDEYRARMAEMLAASKRLVIDLREHEGGNVSSGIDFLREIVGSASLFSFDTKGRTIRWINVDDTLRRKKTKLLYPNPILVRVGRNTRSSGEMLAIIFDRPGPYTIRGKSGGYLSANEQMTWYGLNIGVTTARVRSINRIYHDEIIDC